MTVGELRDLLARHSHEQRVVVFDGEWQSYRDVIRVQRVHGYDKDNGEFHDAGWASGGESVYEAAELVCDFLAIEKEITVKNSPSNG